LEEEAKAHIGDDRELTVWGEAAADLGGGWEPGKVKAGTQRSATGSGFSKTKVTLNEAICGTRNVSEAGKLIRKDEKKAEKKNRRDREAEVPRG